MYKYVVVIANLLQNYLVPREQGHHFETKIQVEVNV